jgi:hypothetical protein
MAHFPSDAAYAGHDVLLLPVIPPRTSNRDARRATTMVPRQIADILKEEAI